jgi:hypothetical protein
VFDWYTRNRMHNPKVKFLISYAYIFIRISHGRIVLYERQGLSRSSVFLLPKYCCTVTCRELLNKLSCYNRGFIRHLSGGTEVNHEINSATIASFPGGVHRITSHRK